MNFGLFALCYAIPFVEMADFIIAKNDVTQEAVIALNNTKNKDSTLTRINRTAIESNFKTSRPHVVDQNSANVSHTIDYANITYKIDGHSINGTKLSMLYKIHSTLTRSKDAVWATLTLTFMCVVLLLAVAQSRMWKDYKGTEMHGVPLPNFNERVPFKEVMERKIETLKELLHKGKRKKTEQTELESLLSSSDMMNECKDDITW